MSRKVAYSTVVTTLLLPLVGCEDCPRAVLQRTLSPDQAFEAAVYSDACGPTAPFDTRVGLRRVRDPSFTEVTSIKDAAFEPNLKWVSPAVLQVEFECPKDPIAACQPPTERFWSVTTTSAVGQVRIEYRVGARLRSVLSPDALAKVLK